MPETELLSPEEFQALLADLLGVDRARVRSESSFVDDLGVDSLRMVGLLLSLAERGYELPPEMAWEIHTVGDAYRYYERHGGR